MRGVYMCAYVASHMQFTGAEVMGIMKPANVVMGLSMLFALGLGACAAPYGEDAQESPREESVKSTDQELAVDALRSRVQQDFVSVPSLQGHEIIVVVDRISGTPGEIAIHARIMKRTGDGKELDLDVSDIRGVVDGHARSNLDVRSPYRAGVSAIVVKDAGGNWSTLKRGLLGSRAVEAYVLGQSPDVFEGWAQDFVQHRQQQSRTGVPGI